MDGVCYTMYAARRTPQYVVAFSLLESLKFSNFLSQILKPNASAASYIE